MSPLVYFARHGQTDWNAEYRLQGQADTDLNDFGRAQADLCGRRLAQLIDDPTSFDFVASPMRRTRETMERIRSAMSLAPDGYRTEPRLVEINFGEWQGYTFPELEQREPGSAAARQRDKWGFVPPGAGAESYAMLMERVRPVFEELSRPTVCVTHGGVIRTLFRMVENLSANEAAALEIVQDRVLKLENSRLEWL